MSPYPDLSTLPAGVRNSLPLFARVIYMNAYNHAWSEYKDSKTRMAGRSREETAGRVAWAAVKKKYEKDAKTGAWKMKTSPKTVRGQ